MDRSRQTKLSSVCHFGILVCLLVLLSVLLAGESLAHPDRYENLRPGGKVCRISGEELQISLLPSEGTVQLRSYRFSCPTLPLGDECLAVGLNHQFVRIEIDGSEVYRSSPSERGHPGRSPGRYWALVPLQRDDVGKTIRLLVEDCRSKRASSPPTIVIADKGDLLLSAIREKWSALSVTQLCITIGLTYMASTLILRMKRRETLSLFYLGSFTALFGLFRLADLSVSAMYISYINGNPHFLSMLSLLSCSLIPMLLDRYLSWVHQERTAYRRMSAAMGFLPLAVFTLELSGLSDLPRLLDLVTALLYLNLLLMILLSLQDLLRDLTKARRDSIRWLYLLMGLACFFDTRSLLRNDRGRVSEVTLWMVMLYALVRGVAEVRRAYRERERMQQSRAEVAEQQVALLINQAKYHFIYNTMNTIYSLCDLDVDKARQVVHDFSRYLRMNAEGMEQARPISFLKELDHTRYYLSIESIRFPDRFTVVYDIGSDAFSLPALSLQPIAENAVHHGLLPKEGPGLLEIRTRETPSHWIVTVRDNGVGFDPLLFAEDPPGSHIGLANVRRRIELLCHGTLKLESISGEGTLATISIPKEAEP